MSVSLPEGTWCDSRWSFPLPRFAFWTLLYRRARLSFRNSSLSHHSLPRADDIHVDSSRAPVEIFSLCWNPIFVTHSKPNGNIIGYLLLDYIRLYTVCIYIYWILSIGLLDLYRGKYTANHDVPPKKTWGFLRIFPRNSLTMLVPDLACLGLRNLEKIIPSWAVFL